MASSIHDIPGAHRATAYLSAAAAGDATDEEVVFVAPFACKVRKVTVVPAAAVTGANTNSRNINLINRGTDGSGTTELANRDYLSGTNESKAVARDLYAPATYLALAAGVVLAVQSELVGTGLALPSFHVVVEFEGN